MDLKEELLFLKDLGVSYKFISYLTNINQNTLYSFICGKRNLSPEKIEKIKKCIEQLLSLKNTWD